MDVKQERFWDLATKRLTREATDSEEEELNGYLANPTYQELFEWMEEKWKTYPETLASPFHTEDELNHLHLRMNQESVHTFNRQPAKILRANRFQLLAAAIILLLLSVAGIFWVNQSIPLPKTIAEDTHATIYRVGNGQAPEKFSLDDGSTVWLNANSKLEVVNTLQDSIRMVRLEGEAFFDVSRDTTKPFIVQTNSILTRVLGTSFNIMAYQSEPYIVAVEEGKVEVSNDQSNRVILTPNQRVYISESEGTWEQSAVQTNRISSWRQGVIWCNYSPLEALVPKFERRFGIKFTFKDEQSKKCLIGGKLNIDELNGLLLGLNTLYNIEYEYNEKEHLVYLYGGKCE